MDTSIIIFTLLFILVIILIVLHKSNKKYADKISILEQTLNMKVDAITSLKRTYADAKRAIDKHATQESKIALQIQTINHLENNIQTLKVNLQSQKDDLQEASNKIETMHHELRKKEKQNDETKHKYEKEIEGVKNSVYELEHHLASKEDKIREIHKEVHNKSLHANELKEQMQITIDRYKEEVVSLKEAYQDVQNDANKKDANYKQKLEKKEENIESLQREHFSHIKLLNEKIQTLEEQHQQQKDFILTLNHEYEELEISYQKEKELYNQKIIEKDNMINHLKITYEEKLINYKERLNYKVAFIQEQKEHIATIEVLDSASKSKIESLEEIIQNKTDEYQRLIENISRQEERIIEIQEERNSLQNELTHIQGLYGIEKEKVNRATLEIKILSSEYKEKEKNLKNNYDVSLSKQKEMKLEIDKMQRDYTALKLQIKTFEDDMTILNYKHEKITNEYRELKIKFDKESEDKKAIELKNIEMKNILLAQNKEIESKEKKKLLSDKKLSTYKNKIILLEKNIVTQIENYTLQVDHLKSLLVDKENSIAKAKEKIDGLNVQINSLEVNLEQSKNKMTKVIETIGEDKTQKEYHKILNQIRKGDNMYTIAKAFKVPIKRIELIAKFDKIQREK